MRWFTVIAVLGLCAAFNHVKKELVSEKKRDVSSRPND